ncbi:MAG: hypothetical protein GY940_24115 [bacterium]|nr:hypothetical protein [bacterium]
MKPSILIIVLIASFMLVNLNCSGKKSNDEKDGEKKYHQEIFSVLDRAKKLSLDNKIKSLRLALDAYYMDHNEYPEMLDMLMPNYVPTLEPLADPWGTQFKIETDEEMNLTLVSAGQDRTFGSPDDIKRRI